MNIQRYSNTDLVEKTYLTGLVRLTVDPTEDISITSVAHNFGRTPFIKGKISKDNSEWGVIGSLILFNQSPPLEYTVTMFTDSNNAYFASQYVASTLVPYIYFKYWLYFIERT